MKHEIIRQAYTQAEIAEVRRLGPTRYAMASNVPINVVAMRLLYSIPWVEDRPVETCGYVDASGGPCVLPKGHDATNGHDDEYFGQVP